MSAYGTSRKQGREIVFVRSRRQSRHPGNIALRRRYARLISPYFNIQMLISDPPYIASRLDFDCTPNGLFLGIHVGGKRVSFAENVIYEFRNEKIEQVWSVINKAAIEAQLWCEKSPWPAQIVPGTSLE